MAELIDNTGYYAIIDVTEDEFNRIVEEIKDEAISETDIEKGLAYFCNNDIERASILKITGLKEIDVKYNDWFKISKFKTV